MTLFSWEVCGYSRRKMSDPILHAVEQCVFTKAERVCCTGLYAVQVCLPLRTYGASSRGKSDNDDHRLLSIWNFIFSKTGDKFLSQNCNNYPLFPNNKTENAIKACLFPLTLYFEHVIRWILIKLMLHIRKCKRTFFLEFENAGGSDILNFLCVRVICVWYAGQKQIHLYTL